MKRAGADHAILINRTIKQICGKGKVTTMDEKNIFENLNEELKNKLKACKSKEEAEAVLKEYGGELSDEIVEIVSGGWDERSGHCEWMDFHP